MMFTRTVLTGPSASGTKIATPSRFSGVGHHRLKAGGLGHRLAVFDQAVNMEGQGLFRHAAPRALSRSPPAVTQSGKSGNDTP